MNKEGPDFTPILLSILSFVVYLGTMSPVVYLGDSGELTAAAFSLGIPHGSGYPLYTLIGKLFCLIPLGNVGFRMNLMSAFFASATLWLVYFLVCRITASKLAAFVGALILAFASEFWFQTVAAEVYALHAFFVVLLMRLLWWWDERREFACLITFVFVTGLSFGNHLQTVMLAPAVLFMIISTDKKTLFVPKNVIILSVVFIIALSIYLYLPIRTNAGAAIHWGDPNSLDRFLAHVSGKTHRAGYVLNKTPLEYLLRTKETLWLIWSQFGVVVLLALWGWFRLDEVRWRVFFVLVIIFDFAYAIFLNTISLEITPFVLPTFVVLTVLAGVGVGDLLKKLDAISSIGSGSQRVIKVAVSVIPGIFLLLNYDLCNQSRNYTAYEEALNIFRTTGNGEVLFMHDDNNVFPVAYGRIVERMRKDVKLYDYLNLIFKLPNLDTEVNSMGPAWENRIFNAEKKIIEQEERRSVYYAVWAPKTIKIPVQYQLVPFGLINKVMKVGEMKKIENANEVWRYYSLESFNEDFYRDYMNREVAAFFHFNHAKHFFESDKFPLALKYIKRASDVGHKDVLIHSEMAIFLIDRGLFAEGHNELEKATINYKNLDGLYNNWGYYYHKIGDYNRAVISFQKAIELSPNNYGYHNHLGFSLYEAGRREEAYQSFQRSLDIKPDQPDLRDFLEKYGFSQETRPQVGVSSADRKRQPFSESKPKISDQN
jgi:tetratricopeptide (TPR) repeat protein